MRMIQQGHREVSSYPLLPTKLYIPQQPSYAVLRERLIVKLSLAMKRKLTVITSPPGFGKTTTVGQWIQLEHIRAGWVSLDQGDNDLYRFWSYVIAALDRLYPGVGDRPLSLLATMTCSVEQMIAWLVNDLFDKPDDVVLVLDDYHMIASDEVHSSFALFLDRLPPQIHLCVMSRQQLPIPVGTLRVQGQLNEIGLADLKFSEREISSFWQYQTGDAPEEKALKLLIDRTEGWVAGVQLAILAQVSGQPDALRHFMGSHRFVVDYLMEEVFRGLPAPIRSFLLQTSVLERLSAGLCAELTGVPAEEDRLREIEEEQLFLIPLDGEGRWFRYHHLFADFLRSRLKQEESGRLHRKAGEWFERHGYVREAIEHLLSGGAMEQACALIHGMAAELLRRRELATLHRWLTSLPSSTRSRPALLIIQVWTELLMGRYEQMDDHIAMLKETLDSADPSEASLNAGIREDLNVAVAYKALLDGDFKLSYSLLAQLYSRDDLPDFKTTPMLFELGVELNDGIAPFIRGHYGFGGRLKLAEKYHRLYHSFIQKNGFAHFPYTAYQRVALAEICYERNQLAESLQLAEEASRIARLRSLWGAYVTAEMLRSDICRVNGAQSVATGIVCEAIELLETAGCRDTRYKDLLQAHLVRFRLLEGNDEAVRQWLDAVPWGKGRDWAGDHDYEILTYIRASMGTDDDNNALAWAEQLVKQAKASRRIMTELEALLCIARIHYGRDNIHTSMTYLHLALLIGEREGYMRIFADMGMGTPLRRYAEARKNRYMGWVQSSGVSMLYLQQVLAVARSAAAGETDSDSEDGFKEVQLTAREHEVLRLISDGLSNKAIAEKLVLAEGTVKLHLHRIYGKLQVTGRIQAIQKAHQLRL